MSDRGLWFKGDECVVATARQTRFTTLDGIRGVAALSVVQYHSSDLFGIELSSSYLAVDLFFMLSGIVLSHSYEQRMRAGLSLKSFILARAIRLYPLYVAGTLAGVAFFLANHYLGHGTGSLVGLAPALALGLLFLPTPAGWVLANTDVFPLLYPAWSLFFELLVNLLYAVMLPVLSLRVLILVIGFGAVLVVQSAFQFDGLNSGFNWSNFSGGFGRVIFSYFTGVLLVRFLPKWRGNGLCAATCVVALVLIFAAPMSGKYRVIFDLIVVLVVFPVLSFVSAASEGGAGLRQAFVFIGSLSYAVYTLHAPVLWWLRGIVPRALGGVQLSQLSPLSGLCSIIFLSLLAFMMDRCFDSPIRRRLTVWLHPQFRRLERSGSIGRASEPM
ncbi:MULTISPECIES: acyltransferase [unclassified Rhizobium]|uniref:acyltransferase family protein n=1 Tax=unclassified Rhizobium TaxID=2613769 RepID=UPI001044A86F|nr:MULTISPECIES: acyltransferase [unclassified Rhizobium]MBB4170286.1 peptidoglycan/LPS O-acetylase OafA/YrhL [Rhizobium sp. BK538]TCM76223.1 peptidoglycan/LPS O-acetylase OafA/YrhL [Rhizobium sp. BK068]